MYINLSILNARGCRNVNPNSRQLRVMISELYYAKLMINNIVSNCLADNTEYLFNINSKYKLPIRV